MATAETVNAGGGVKLELEGLGPLLRLFKEQLDPSRQRSAYRAAGNKAAVIVKRSGRRLAPVGHGMDPRGNKRKHLRQALIHNTATLKGGSVSTIVGADYRIAPHMHLAHEGARAVQNVQPKKSRLLSNQKVAPNKYGPARIFGTVVNIPARKGTPFLKQALDENKSAIEAAYAAAIRKSLSKVGL